MALRPRTSALLSSILSASLGTWLGAGRARAEDPREVSNEASRVGEFREPAPEVPLAAPSAPSTVTVAPLTAEPGHAAYPESARDEQATPTAIAIDASAQGGFLSHTEQHHEGFFLRLTAGGGAGTATYREQVDGRGADVQTRGLTGLLELAVGGSVAEHVVLHGNLLLTGFGDAHRTVNGIRDASQQPTTTMTMVGGGASYYFPLNVYLTGSLGLAWFVEERAAQDFRSRTGLGLCFAMGKEWWVGHAGQWGVGAALRAGVATGAADLAGDHTRVRSGHIGVAVSATLN